MFQPIVPVFCIMCGDRIVRYRWEHGHYRPLTRKHAKTCSVCCRVELHRWKAKGLAPLYDGQTGKRVDGKEDYQP